MRRIRVRAGIAVVAAVAGLAGCTVAQPFTTAGIVRTAQGVQSGYRWEYYEHRAYSCGASGWQTFLVVWPDGVAAGTPRPLWVRLHGGGVAAWNREGQYVPPQFLASLDQETAAQLSGPMFEQGLTRLAREHPAGFRFLFPSLCDHDLYAGIGSADPDNPNPPDENGNARATDGLLATKAAIAFTRDRFATTDTVLHGTSAGSYGAFFVGWGLEEHGTPVTAIVLDSGVGSREFQDAMRAYLEDDPDACPGSSFSGQDWEALGRRFVQLGWPWWEPAPAVAGGALTTPVLHLWDRRDPAGCADTPIPYVDADGNPQVEAAMDFRHRALAAAIDGLDGSPSENLRVCTRRDGGGCGVHTPTTDVAVDADTGRDVNEQVMAWIDAVLDTA